MHTMGKAPYKTLTLAMTLADVDEHCSLNFSLGEGLGSHMPNGHGALPKTHPFAASRMTEIKNNPIKQGMRAIRPRFGCIDLHKRSGVNEVE